MARRSTAGGESCVVAPVGRGYHERVSTPSDSSRPPDPDGGWQLGDDAAVKARLAGELARLSGARDPRSVLGVARTADRTALRAAFLAATKAFHPNRFARRGPEIQRIANEVFLQFKHAYEQVQQPAAATAGKASAPRRAASAAAGPPAPPARERPSRPAPRAAAGAGSGEVRTIKRAVPPPIPADARRRSARGTGAAGRTAAGDARNRATPALGVARAAGTPPAGMPMPRERPDGSKQLSAEVAHAARERKEVAAASFDSALKLLKDGKPAEARVRFRQLAVEHPQDRRYRVYLHYAWGREHMAAGRPDQARAELGRALGIDPEFAAARRDLDALSRKRPGRLLGKLFGK